MLSGPSGVGKSTVAAALRRDHPEIWISVSVTTRRPRPGEVNGREYRFVDEREFDRLVAAGELLEWAEFADFLVERIPLLEQEWRARREELRATGKLPDDPAPIEKVENNE